jgi:hypothetical protein
LVCALLISSCDDGDIVLQSFNFDNVAIQKCSDKEVLFKINKDELLLLDIPSVYFPNEITPVGEPRIATISSINRVLYRKYSGNASNSTICSDVPPASPAVLNEWGAANGGTIEIVTTARTVTDEITGEVTITGYNHQIKFINIQFVGAQDSFVFDEYLYGTYTTSL